MKKLINIYILLLLFNKSLSQDKTNTELINSIISTSTNNPKLAKENSYKLLKIARLQGNKKDEGIAYIYLADFSSLNLQNDSAYYYFDKAIQKAIETNDNSYELLYKINKAIFISNQNDFNGALELYNECLQLAEKNNDQKKYAFLMIKRGEIFYEIERYQEALEILKKGEQNKDFNQLIRQEILFYLSKTYLKLNSPNLAYKNIKEGISISKKEKNYDYEISFNNQLASYFIYKKEYRNAEIIFNKTLPLINKYGVEDYKRLTLIKIAKLFTLEKKYQESIKILNQILINTEKKPLLTESIVEVDNILAENYKQIGDTKNASLYLEKYIEDSKKIGQKKIETIEYLNNLNINEIEQEKASLTSQKWILICILGTLCILFGYYIHKRRKSDQQKFDFLIQKIEKYETDLKLEEKTDSNDIHLNQHSFTNLNNNPQESTTTNNDKIIDQSLDIEEIEDDTNNIELLNTQEEIKEENISGFIIKDEKINEILDGLIKLDRKSVV